MGAKLKELAERYNEKQQKSQVTGIPDVASGGAKDGTTPLCKIPKCEDYPADRLPLLMPMRWRWPMLRPPLRKNGDGGRFIDDKTSW